jgi:hypothetical protein
MQLPDRLRDQLPGLPPDPLMDLSRPARVRYAPFRVGVYLGITISVSLLAWIIVANRVPFLDPFDRERNLAATTLIGFFALIPVIKYMHAPRSLLAAGLVGWTILSFVYRLLCLYFHGLAGIHTPTQVLMLGVLFYLISATVAWVGSVIWRVRQSDSSHSHVNH